MASQRPGKVLQLVRHAKSSWADSSLSDIDRPLSGRGKRAARALAQHLAEADELPEFVLCSPAKRARQTLAAARGVLRTGAVIRIEPVVYEGGLDELFGMLSDLPPAAGTVMVIGHNPTLQDLALQLIDPGETPELVRLRDKFPTGSMATLVVPEGWDMLASGCARLHSFWTPR